MIDPIALLLRLYFGLFPFHGMGAILIQLGLVVMVGCAFFPGMMRAKHRARARQTARLQRVVIARIRDLLPAYQAAAESWCARIEKTVAPLGYVAHKIPGDVLTKAEHDFCLQDAERAEIVSLLQLQMVDLLQQQKLRLVGLAGFTRISPEGEVMGGDR